jgi:hypothetical protein
MSYQTGKLDSDTMKWLEAYGPASEQSLVSTLLRHSRQGASKTYGPSLQVSLSSDAT